MDPVTIALVLGVGYLMLRRPSATPAGGPGGPQDTLDLLAGGATQSLPPISGLGLMLPSWQTSGVTRGIPGYAGAGPDDPAVLHALMESPVGHPGAPASDATTVAMAATTAGTAAATASPAPDVQTALAQLDAARAAAASIADPRQRYYALNHADTVFATQLAILGVSDPRGNRSITLARNARGELYMPQPPANMATLDLLGNDVVRSGGSREQAAAVQGIAQIANHTGGVFGADQYPTTTGGFQAWANSPGAQQWYGSLDAGTQATVADLYVTATHG